MIYVGEIIYINDKHKHGTILNLDEHLRTISYEGGRFYEGNSS